MSRISRSRPALTLEARQNQIVSKAINLAEKQIDEGTASSQVLTHFLKLGTVQAEVELEKLKQENELIKAKAEAIASAKRVEDLYAEAMMAFKSYSGQVPNTYNEEDDDEYDYDERY